MKSFTPDAVPDSVLTEMRAPNKTIALEHLAKEASTLCEFSPESILAQLLEKEQAASSGIGDGVAIPHCKLRGLKKPITILAQLKSPLPFDSLDGRPIDLMCLIVSPEREGVLHLQRLARISRMMRNGMLREHLRSAPNADTIKAVLMASNDQCLAA